MTKVGTAKVLTFQVLIKLVTLMRFAAGNAAKDSFKQAL